MQEMPKNKIQFLFLGIFMILIIRSINYGKSNFSHQQIKSVQYLSPSRSRKEAVNWVIL